MTQGEKTANPKAHEFIISTVSDQLIIFLQKFGRIESIYNCSRPPTFKRQRVGYQSNQKLLHHYPHLNNQVNSNIHSEDTADFRVS